MRGKCLLAVVCMLGSLGSAWAAQVVTPPVEVAPPAPDVAPAPPEALYPGNAKFGPAELPNHVVRVLRTSNKAQTNRYVPKVYRMQNVNPFDVVRFYRRVMEIEEGRFASFVAPDGQSGLVLVVAPEYQIPYIDELMALLDRPGLTSSSGDVRKYLKLDWRAADDTGFLWAVWGQANHNASRPANGSVVQETEVLVDLETGAIYLEGPPSGVDAAMAVMAALDRPVPQVLIEASVYELDLSSNGAIGLDYLAWKNGPGRNLFALGAFAEFEETDRLRGGVPILDTGVDTFGLPHGRFANHGYNAAYFYDVPSAYFDFLVANGVARVLTSGRVLSKIPSSYKGGLNEFGQDDFNPVTDRPTLSLPPAEFAAADEVLFYRVFTGPTARAGARPPSFSLDPFGDDVDYPGNRAVAGLLTPRAAGGEEILGRTIAGVDVGALLRVTPRIGVENILLKLDLEAASLLGFDGAGEPLLAARRAHSDVRVVDGEEFLFGGLERTVRVQSANKVPVLGSIPGLGWAFGGERNGIRRTLVVAAVRAYLMPSGVPEELAPVMAQVEGGVPTALPEGSIGFDQWLLDQ